MFDRSFFHETDKTYNFNNPAWHLLYRKPASHLRELEDRVITLLKFDVTKDMFGFTYHSLMELDLPTFSRIEETVFKFVKEREDAKKEMEQNQK